MSLTYVRVYPSSYSETLYSLRPVQFRTVCRSRCSTSPSRTARFVLSDYETKMYRVLYIEVGDARHASILPGKCLVILWLDFLGMRSREDN